jgi:FkbM family methyltransferase
MKLREFANLLGFRANPRSYGLDVVSFELAREGRVEYARWLHPREKPKELSQEVVDELRKYIAPGDVALDIGAHTGDTTVPMALAAGSAGRVIALEPNPYVFPVLERNASLNLDRTCIVPLMFAAVDKDGVYEFEYADAGFCNGGLHPGISRWRHGHAFKLEVEGRNLATFLAERFPELLSRIRYVKVDAEGYDLEVLRTLRALLESERPYVCAEVFKLLGRVKREQMFDFFAGLGYGLHRVVSATHLAGPPLQRDDMLSMPHFDIFAVPKAT